MGSSQSSFTGESSGTKRKTNNLRDHAFIWEIVGFTNLSDIEKIGTSTSFWMHGFLWTLCITPMNTDSEDKGSEKHVSLCLWVSSSSISPKYNLETKLKFFIHNQRYGKHVEHEVSHKFTSTRLGSGACRMLPLQTLKNPSSGFLIKDTVKVGVEFIQVEKVPCNTVCTRSIVEANKPCWYLYTWYIDDFAQLSRKPIAYSKPFRVAGYLWKLSLVPASGPYKNNVGLSLVLDSNSVSQLSKSSGVMVDATLSIKKQPEGAYKLRMRNVFSQCSQSFGWSEFIRLSEFKNPLNGYLIKGTCTIEVLFCTIGSSQ